MMRIDRELGKEGFQRINFLETKSDLPIIVEVLHRVNCFSKFHKPVEYVDLGELVMLETKDAVGSQVKSKDMAFLHF